MTGKWSTTAGESVTQIEKNHGFIRIDMSEYQHSHTVAGLMGKSRLQLDDVD